MTPAERQLVADHTALAERLAARATVAMPDIWRDDLHSAALEGLIAAAITYDPAKGIAFSSWAHTCIVRVIEDQRRALFAGRLNTKRTHRADDREPVRYKDRRVDVSIDNTIGDDIDKTHADNPIFEQPGADPQDIYADGAHAADDALAVRGALATLTPVERALLRRYYHDGETLAHIGRQEGITEAGVSYRLKRIRTKLRRSKSHDPNPDNH